MIKLLPGFCALLLTTCQYPSVTNAQPLSTTIVSDCVNYGDESSPGTFSAALASKPDTIAFECTGMLVVPEITLDFEVTVLGQNGLILNGNNNNRVLRIPRGNTVTLDNLIITNGHAQTSASDKGRGGGILNAGTLTLNKITVRNNTADTAGGIYNLGGLLYVYDVAVNNNLAIFNGGIYNSGQISGTDLTINDNVSNNAILNSHGVFNIDGCFLTGNRTNSSPAIANQSGAFMTLKQCHLQDNAASMIDNDGSLTVKESRFTNNGENQSEISNTGKLDIESTTFSNNKDESPTIQNSGLATLTNVTISGNRFSAIGNSGLMYIYSSTIIGQNQLQALPDILVKNTGELRLANSIVVGGNAVTECGGSSPVSSDGYNLHTDGSCYATQATDITVSNPQLAPLEDNGGIGKTHALLSISAAIDNGNCDAGAVDTDQRGIARPQGIACDIGAFERTPTDHPYCGPNAIDPDGDGWGWENNLSCRMRNHPPPFCINPDSDPDGDGWGWENNQSCRVKAGHPYCKRQDSDPDGDGWGWENEKSCKVNKQVEPDF